MLLLQCTPREAVVPEASPASVVASASTLADAERLDARSKEREEARDFASALDDALQALDIRQRLLDPSDVGIALSLLRVARVHWILGHYPDVAAAIHRALPVLEKELGPDAIDVGRALVLRSAVILHDRRYREAQALVERALAILEKSPPVGENVDVDLHEAIGDLGLVHYGLADYPRAIASYERALAFGEQRFGSNSWRLASSIGGIGESIRMSGDPHRALPYMERSLALYEKGPYARHVASALNNLANIHSYALHDYAKAEPLYRRAIAISEKVYGSDDINTAQEYMNLAGMLCVQGDWTNGEPLYQKGLDVFERKLGTGHVEYVRAKQYLESLRQRKP